MAALTCVAGRRVRMGLVLRLAVAWVIAASAGGCATGPEEGEGTSVKRVARRPAPITHVVLVSLTDPGLRDELLRDCDGLAKIPGLVFFSAGPPMEVSRDDAGRGNVDSAFEVALCMGFADSDGYRGYVGHPVHQKLLRDWGPRVKSLRIFDMADETP